MIDVELWMVGRERPHRFRVDPLTASQMAEWCQSPRRPVDVFTVTVDGVTTMVMWQHMQFIRFT